MYGRGSILTNKVVDLWAYWVYFVKCVETSCSFILMHKYYPNWESRC